MALASGRGASTSLRDARVLITGGTGFLGSHLARSLVRAGVRPHVAVRAESSLDRIRDLEPVLRFTHVDLFDQASVDACVEAIRPDIVFHLAAMTSGRRSAAPSDNLASHYEVNLDGTRRLLEAVARTVPAARVIRTGSVAEYGRAPLPFREEQREEPVSTYGASQLAATHLGEALCRQFGLAVTTLRLALTYGPAQSAEFFVPALIHACLERRAFEMTRGDQTRDYLYVDDATEAIVQAAAVQDVGGQVVNVGSGREYRVADVAALIVRLTGAQIDLRVGAMVAGGADLLRQVLDTGRARQRLGWVASTSLERGLEQTVAWYRAAGPG